MTLEHRENAANMCRKQLKDLEDWQEFGYPPDWNEWDSARESAFRISRLKWIERMERVD